MVDYLEVATQHHWSTPQAQRDAFGSNLGPRYDLGTGGNTEKNNFVGGGSGSGSAEIVGALVATAMTAVILYFVHRSNRKR